MRRVPIVCAGSDGSVEVPFDILCGTELVCCGSQAI